jgi:hypothetical protein
VSRHTNARQHVFAMIASTTFVCAAIALSALRAPRLGAQQSPAMPTYGPLPTLIAPTSPLALVVSLPSGPLSLERALRELSRVSGVRITFGEEVLAASSAPTVRNAARVVDLLQVLLRGKALMALVTADQRAVVIVGAGRVTGRVVDRATGDPVAGATLRSASLGADVQTAQETSG